MWGNPRHSWILDSTPWIPDSNYWIPDLFQWNFDSGFGLLVGFRIPTPVFRIPQAKISKISDSKCKNFPDSGIRIPLHGASVCWIRTMLSRSLRLLLQESNDRQLKSRNKVWNKVLQYLSKSLFHFVPSFCLFEVCIVDVILFTVSLSDHGKGLRTRNHLKYCIQPGVVVCASFFPHRIVIGFWNPLLTL